MQLKDKPRYVCITQKIKMVPIRTIRTLFVVTAMAPSFGVVCGVPI